MSSVEERVTGTGSSVSLPCSLLRGQDGPRRYVLEWRKDGDVVYTLTSWGQDLSAPPQGSPSLLYRGRASHGEDGSLRLAGVRSSDAGTYFCVLKTFDRPAQNPHSLHIKLQVQTLPFFVDEGSVSERAWVGEGKSFSISCRADGIPPPKITWTKDGAGVSGMGRVRVEEGGGRLRVDGLRAGDEGDYACVAANPLGTISRTTKLAFPKPAWLDLTPGNLTAMEGSTVMWRCHAQADPADSALHYQWYAGDTEILYANLALRAQLVGSNLRISGVRREDRGWYRCQASNGYGQPASAAAYLDVHYEAEISRLTEAIQHMPLGLPSSINCRVDANPPASFVNWAKEGRVIDTRHPDAHHSTSNNGAVLHFDLVRTDDAGIYSCQAYNSVGGSNPFEVHVLVQEPPYFVTEPAGVTRKEVGESLALDCAGGGRPEPSVFWKRADNAPLPLSATQTALNSTHRLSIPQLHPDHHGLYQCVVQNKVTSISRDALVQVQNTAPQAPTGVRVAPGAFDARISWTPGYDGARPPQMFTLRYRMANGGDWVQHDTGRNASYTVAYLHPDVLYEYQVEPRNELGPGFRSSLVQMRTLGYDAIGKVLPTDSTGSEYFPALQRPIGPRPGPPQNLELVTSPAAGVELAWEPPRTSQIPVYFYAVEYKPNVERSSSVPRRVEADEEGFRPLRSKVTDTRVKMGPGMYPELAEGETYDLRVRSHSLAAFSLPSNHVTYTVPGMGMQTALLAGIIGGVAFAFFAFALLCVCIARRSSSSKLKYGASNPYASANGKSGFECRDGGFTPEAAQLSAFSNGKKSVSGPAISLAGPPVSQFRSAGLGGAPFYSVSAARLRSQRSSFRQPRLHSLADLLEQCGEEAAPPADLHIRPVGRAGYLVRAQAVAESPYSRDRLLHTISKLRESTREATIPEEAPREMDWRDWASESSGEKATVGPSPSASSTSGVSSESGNALNSALAERYVAEATRQGALWPLSSAALEDQRLGRLKAEFRLAQHSQPRPSPSPTLTTTLDTGLL